MVRIFKEFQELREAGVPQKRSMSWSPDSVNVTLNGRRAFTDMIKIRPWRPKGYAALCRRSHSNHMPSENVRPFPSCGQGEMQWPKMVRKNESLRRVLCPLAGSGTNRLCSKTRARLLGPQSGPQLIASQKMETSVLQPHGNAFCQHQIQQCNCTGLTG